MSVSSVSLESVDDTGIPFSSVILTLTLWSITNSQIDKLDYITRLDLQQTGNLVDLANRSIHHHRLSHFEEYESTLCFRPCIPSIN